jgi:hypothetical protein
MKVGLKSSWERSLASDPPQKTLQSDLQRSIASW